MTLSSPEQAETAFYSAFEKADLSAMMAVWAEDEALPPDAAAPDAPVGTLH